MYFYTEGCFLLLRPFRHSLARRVLSFHYALYITVAIYRGIDFNNLAYVELPGTVICEYKARERIHRGVLIRDY